MKILIKIFIFLLITNAHSDDAIKYIDINYIIKNSKIGVTFNKILEKKNNDILKDLEKQKVALDNKKEIITAQKNILDEKNYLDLVKEFQNDVNKFNILQNEKNNEFNNFRVKANNELLRVINPIITEYLDKNSVSILLQKDNIIFGNKDLDITQPIIEILNSRKIELKIN
jgi:Skp family chaperone for outer membrane proteins